MNYWCDKSIKGLVGIVKDINDILTITETDSVTTHNITIPSGLYNTSYIQHTSSLIDELNKQLDNGLIPFKAINGATFGKLPDFTVDNSPSTILANWSKYGKDKWTVIDDKLKSLVNDATDNIIFEPYRFGCRNLELSADFMADEDDDIFGIIFRYKDNLNYYKLGYEGGGMSYGSTKIILFKVVNGVESVVKASNVSDVWQLNTTYNLKVVVNEDNIKVYLNNGLVIDTTDYTFRYGTYGFFGYSQIFYLSNINIVDGELIAQATDPRRNTLVLVPKSDGHEVQALSGSAKPIFELY